MSLKSTPLSRIQTSKIPSHPPPLSLQPKSAVQEEKTWVEDAILPLPHRTLSHLDEHRGTVRILALITPVPFNAIQSLPKEKLTSIQVYAYLVHWITDYPSEGRRERSYSSSLAPTTDFSYNSELCHLQKFYEHWPRLQEGAEQAILPEETGSH